MRVMISLAGTRAKFAGNLHQAERRPSSARAALSLPVHVADAFRAVLLDEKMIRRWRQKS